MLTKNQIQKIINKITYRPDWEFVVKEKGDGIFIQIQFEAFDSNNGDKRGSQILQRQFCRNWHISRFASKTEIVRTVFKACLAVEEHEAAERFRYRGETIFNPHINVEKQVKLCKNRRNLYDLRPRMPHEPVKD